VPGSETVVRSPIVTVIKRPFHLLHIDLVGTTWALSVTTPPKLLGEDGVISGAGHDMSRVHKALQCHLRSPHRRSRTGGGRH